MVKHRVFYSFAQAFLVFIQKPEIWVSLMCIIYSLIALVFEGNFISASQIETSGPKSFTLGLPLRNLECIMVASDEFMQQGLYLLIFFVNHSALSIQIC
jgi:hypothetical protein